MVDGPARKGPYLSFLKFEELEHNKILTDSGEPAFRLRRAKIPGGWLVIFYRLDFSSSPTGGAGFGGMTFVPDPNHTWNGSSLP